MWGLVGIVGFSFYVLSLFNYTCSCLSILLYISDLGEFVLTVNVSIIQLFQCFRPTLLFEKTDLQVNRLMWRSLLEEEANICHFDDTV